jgi:hypothetical protein
MFKNLTQIKGMLDSMTNETLIFLPRIMGLKGLIVEQGMLNVEKGKGSGQSQWSVSVFRNTFLYSITTHFLSLLSLKEPRCSRAHS